MAINAIRCRPVRDCVPVKAVWCSAQCSGGSCPDETWLLAVLGPTKQHHQQPITGSCAGPWRSKPQGLGMPVKSLFHAYLHKCSRCREMFCFKGEILLFFCTEICFLLPQTLFSSILLPSPPYLYQWWEIYSTIKCCFDLQLQREIREEEKKQRVTVSRLCFLRIRMYFLVWNR